VSDGPPTPWWRNDAVIFAALVFIAAIAFSATYVVTSTYKRREDSLARRWYQMGDANLTSGEPKLAVADFRTALLYSRDNPQFRLRLAEALAADNDIPQAIAYFLNLWEEQPGNGNYNLQLARLYARDNQPRKAAQYYNAAIYGVWPGDPVERRRQARMEYVKFLLATHDAANAQAEALALAAATPLSDINGRLQAANLLLVTGDTDHALAEYTALLKLAPAAAAAGAGKAAFELGEFRSAAQYLRAAMERGTQDADATVKLARAQQVLDLDPWARHLSAENRSKRVSTAFVQAGDRLQQCAAIKQQQLAVIPPTTDMQRLYSEWLSTTVDFHKLVQNPDLRDSVMDLVFRIENATALECGDPASGPDWALLMLARNGEGVER
jgi:tetratricopeptide (TPR) repeat protein